MTDFSNVDREKSYLRPSYEHLDLFVTFNNIESVESMFPGEWTYKIKIFGSIPVIVFKCQNRGCNILLHLNYHAIGGLNTAAWFEKDNLTFMLIISDGSENNHVAGAKTIRLSKKDSDSIRVALIQQKTLSHQNIENFIDVFYQLNINNIWPEKDL